MSYIDISTNLPIDPNFTINNINDDKQIEFYNSINSLLKNPAYTDTLSSIKWNTYYYKKYKTENNLLYFIMGICVLIIVLNLLKKSFTYFDDTSYSVIIGFILAYSFIHILYILWSITYKDDLNFDENSYEFDNGQDISGQDIHTSGKKKYCSTNTTDLYEISSSDITSFLNNF